MPRCQVCALHWIPVDTQTGGQRLHGSTVPDEWRGREEEANAWEFSHLTDGQRAAIEWAKRPRAILEPGPEPGSLDAMKLMAFASASLARAHEGDHPAMMEQRRAADARIGHTSREVEATIARICPPRSRRDTRRLVGHLGGIPYYEDSALGDDGMHGYILTRAPR